MKFLTLFATIVLSLFAIAGCQNKHYDNTSTQSASASSNQPITDTTITASVKSKFVSEEVFTSQDIASMTIHVETTNGIVYLTGKGTRTQIKNAIRIARSVDGVKDVVSRVKVVKHN